MWDKIKPEELTENVFHLINDDWMLVAAEDGGKMCIRDSGRTV